MQVDTFVENILGMIECFKEYLREQQRLQVINLV